MVDELVEAKFRASVEAERNKEDVLSRKFAEGLKKAKDAPLEKPLIDHPLRPRPETSDNVGIMMPRPTCCQY